MAKGSFGAQVSEWAAQTRERMDAIRKESAQRIVEIMQTPVQKGGNLPFKTGFLRASLTAAVGDVNLELTTNHSPNGSFTWSSDQVALIIAQAAPSDPVIVAYTAAYARRMEYGFTGQDKAGRTYNQSGKRFVGLAVQQWQRVVNEVSVEVRGRVEGRSAAGTYQGGA